MDADKTRAGPGMHVEIELLSHVGETEYLSLDIVPDASANYAQGFLAESTPLAKAITGHQAGETIPYPQAELYAVRLLSVARSREITLAELAAERQAKYNKVVREAERVSAVNFASSFSGKWGDYDPDSLPKDSE